MVRSLEDNISQHFDMIFNNISDMIFLMSVHENGSFHYQYANVSAIEKIELRANYIGKTLYDVLPQVAADNIVDKYQKAMNEGITITFEDQFIFPYSSNGEGSMCYFESRVTPIFNPSGQCENIIVVTRDMTERVLREQEMEQEKKKVRTAMNYAADILITFDENGDYLSVNPGFTKIFGWTLEELIADRTLTIFPKQLRADFEKLLEKLNKGSVIQNYQTQRHAKNGEIIDVLASYAPIFEKGKMTSGVALYKDITQLIKTQEKLHESEEHYRLIAEHSSDLIRIVDREGMVRYASPSHQSILGVEPEFFINKSALIMAHSDDIAKISHYLKVMIDTKTPQSFELRRLPINGEPIWMEARGTPVLDMMGEVDHMIFVTRDIMHQKVMVEKYKYQALYDHLTDLPNRRLFESHLIKAMDLSRRNKKLTALLMLDCDNFKNVNDTYGHDAGDQVIKEFAATIQKSLRESDTVSRLGGDEFVAILPTLENRHDAIWIAHRILKSFKNTFEINGNELNLTASIGITFFYGDHKNQETLLKEADGALYDAKVKGKNTYAIYSSEKTVSNWKKMRKFMLWKK